MKIQGLYTALATPFSRGAVDYGKLRDLVEFQIAGGVDGIVPAGERGRTVFRYADSNVSAAVCATMDGYKTFCMGFPIETIDDPKAADRLMKDVLTWFGKE